MVHYYDTLLGEYIQNPGQRGLGLDKLSDNYFDYEMIHYDDVTNKSKINFKDVDIDTAANYSAEDVYITHKLYELQKEKNIQNNNILTDIEIPLIDVIRQMEIDGVKISPESLQAISILLNIEILSTQKRIFDKAGIEFNIKSPKQVGEILFEKLELPKGKKTKTGYSVSADVLGELAHDFPIAQDIVDYRHYSKLQSTYIEGLLNLLDKNDFVHTSYNQTVTTTGRLSSTKPNLQNIPSSAGIAGEIREAFISRWEGGNILAADYSQVEVRLLAIMSGDENLIYAFQEGLDIHHKTAEFLFPDTTITNNERKIAKAVNFGVIYGISGFGLAKMIGISMKDAKVYINKFFESYPKVKIYFDNLINNCKEKEYVETMFGRKRFIKGINDKNAIIANAAKREAMNMPIQGSSADIIKLAMIEVSHYLKENNLKSKMIMQVHDELVFDIYPGENDIIAKNIQYIMENILKESLILLKVDVAYGNSWKEAK